MGIKPLARPRHRLEVNIRINLKAISVNAKNCVLLESHCESGIEFWIS